MNTPMALAIQNKIHNVCCFCFAGNKIFAGYEDGLICSFNNEGNKFDFPMLGHTNRINAMLANGEQLITTSDDCTIRMWDMANGHC